jgi:hypothetical protein
VKKLQDFINEVTTEQIQLLSLDIEGIDAEILLDIDFNHLKMKYLSFEYGHLGEKRGSVEKHLQDNNYKYLGLGVDYQGFDYLYINQNVK